MKREQGSTGEGIPTWACARQTSRLHHPWRACASAALARHVRHSKWASRSWEWVVPCMRAHTCRTHGLGHVVRSSHVQDRMRDGLAREGMCTGPGGSDAGRNHGREAAHGREHPRKCHHAFSLPDPHAWLCKWQRQDGPRDDAGLTSFPASLQQMGHCWQALKPKPTQQFVESTQILIQSGRYSWTYTRQAGRYEVRASAMQHTRVSLCILGRSFAEQTSEPCKQARAQSSLQCATSS